MLRACSFALISIIISISWRRCVGLGTFGFDIHHRYSDPVRGILDLHGLPEKGSTGYYVAMAHRDSLFRGRKLAGTTGDSVPLSFFNGNETYRISSLGFLHYANVSVGSPALTYLVALDTGSDLFWLPCDCTSCVHGIKTKSGRVDFNIYSPNTSSTSEVVSCNSSLCGQQRQCSSRQNTCAYKIEYLSNGTSSAGLLVEDKLHLITNDNHGKSVDARITLGCGMVLTGSFLEGAAPNGLFGLGMDNISVPSILASEGFATNSFSMCFGADGTGRISFGDKGSSGQGETPFNLRQRHPTYNVTVTQINVGDNVTDVTLNAIFDTGTSFTYLNDPAYTMIVETFTSQVQEKRRSSDSSIPFEYCYDLGANQQNFETPPVIFTMRGGNKFNVTGPIIIVSDESGSTFYCLALVKSGDINIIGQNFMTGYNIVFNREEMVLGWEKSDCSSSKTSNTLPISPSRPSSSPAPGSLDPEATSGPTGTKSMQSPPNASPHLNPILVTLMGLISLFIYFSGCFF